MEKISIKMQEKDGRGQFLEKACYILSLALVFLLPLFFIPSSSVSFSYSKVILLFVLVLLILFLWAILSFKTGKLNLPFNWISFSSLLVVVIVLLSSILSANRNASFIGSGYEIDTLSSILIFFLLMFLIATFVRSKEKIFYCYLWFAGTFLIVSIYQILHLIFGPNFLSFNYFSSITSNPVGSWNDLAVFSGAAVLLALISLELLVLDKWFKFFSYVALILGLFLLAVTNFVVIWNTPINIITIIGLFALIFFVYFISSSNDNAADVNGENSLTHSSTRKIPLPSLIVLVFAVIFTLASTPLSNYLDNLFHINVTEVEPTWQSTFIVAKGALTHDPLFGVGPNRFDKEWFLSKPDGVNQTDFWDTDFNYGVGFIPTSVVTGGVLGLLSWLFFLGLFIYLGVKSLFSGIKDKFSLYLIVSSFFGAFYLWLMNILYVPSLVTLVFAFIFTGLFLASLYREGILREKSISYVEDSRKGFAVILLLVVIIIGTLTWGYFVANKVAASVYANKSAVALNNNDAVTAEADIVKAVNLDRNPAYYRFLAQIELDRLGAVISQGNTNTSVANNQLSTLLNNAVSAGSAAITLDPTDYQNWIARGSVYEAVVPLGVQNASSSAYNDFQNALKLDPKDPDIYVALANLAAAEKDYTGAQNYIGDAINLKSNDLQAIYLLAQIQVAEGDNASALQSMEAAVSVAPTNASVYFQLGLFEYSLANYSDASAAFNQAVVLVPNYADAEYYLGLSYYKLGETPNAIAEFQKLIAANPGNANLSTILINLQAGRDPLYGFPGGASQTAPANISSTTTASSTKAK